jgi:hypothetical protein
MSTPLRLAPEQARLFAIATQELGEGRASGGSGTVAAPKGSAGVAAVLERTGFVRTLGGVEAYLALFARLPGLRSEDVHAAVTTRAAQVVPAVRGCMYLVAARHVPLCLRVADRLSRARDEREHVKAAIRPGELADVGRAVIDLLRSRGPLTTDALRRTLPEGTVRSLGEAGKKIGLSSTLPPALRRLEFDGLIEREVDGGRLDSERYTWREANQARQARGGRERREGRPRADEVPDDWDQQLAAVAAIYFRAAGIGSIAELAAWAGVSRRDASTAAARLPLIPVEIEGRQGSFAMWEGHRKLLESADAAREIVALLPFEDNLAAYQGGPAALVDPSLHGTVVPGFEADKPVTLGESRHVWGRSLVAEGRLAGLWDYDPDRKTVDLALFRPVARATRARLDDEAHAVSRFLADDIGHGRSYSLDTDDELRRRSAAMRSFAKSGAIPAGSGRAAKTGVAGRAAGSPGSRAGKREAAKGNGVGRTAGGSGGRAGKREAAKPGAKPGGSRARPKSRASRPRR